MKRSLIALALGTFALGITEFGMMGILSDVADSLHVSIVQAAKPLLTFSNAVSVSMGGLTTDQVLGVVCKTECLNLPNMITPSAYEPGLFPCYCLCTIPCPHPPILSALLSSWHLSKRHLQSFFLLSRQVYLRLASVLSWPFLYFYTKKQ
ncbi:MAG: hypothetical protein NC114_07035 [Ruminococcus flavefaciens]|nr:hypothetical protein [Ruminococcus flavefaciens]